MIVPKCRYQLVAVGFRMLGESLVLKAQFFPCVVLLAQLKETYLILGAGGTTSTGKKELSLVFVLLFFDDYIKPTSKLRLRSKMRGGTGTTNGESKSKIVLATARSSGENPSTWRRF